ncbi:MAG: rhomboid family intramembrane serine protease [Planctomycetes bacterium]|nr:rhomboid family intramembrane serine protease [Planctomycetota bacterium]
MLLLPISDENPTQRRPFVTHTLLAVNVLVYLIGLLTGTSEQIFQKFGLVPNNFHFFNLVSSQFIHAGILHLAGNMLFLWIFGDNVEDRLGRGWYLLMYLASGAAGAIGHAIAVAGTEIAQVPLGGASGAISGVLAAYMIFYPNQPVRIFYLILLYPGFFHVRALWVIGVFAGQQVLMIALTRGHDHVAYWAHLVGFIVGAGFALADRWVNGMPAETLAAGAGWKPWRSGRGTSSASRIFRAPPAIPPMELPPAPSFEVPMARVAEGWAVLRADDALVDVSALSAVVARVTGEPVVDAARRIRSTRGVLARGLTVEKARATRDLLKAARGPAAFLVDETAAPPFPPAAAASSAAAGPPGFQFDMADGGKWTVPWNRVVAVFAARLDRRAPAPASGTKLYTRAMERFIETTLVDVITRNPEGRIRLAQDTERFGPAARDESTAEMQAFCSSILRHRGAVPLNNGVAVVAGKGSWGYLRFSGEGDYEDYAWWLFQLISARSSVGKRAWIE